MRSRDHLKVDHRPWEVLFLRFYPHSLLLCHHPHFSTAPLSATSLVSYTAVTHFWLEIFFQTSSMLQGSTIHPREWSICYTGTASRTPVSMALGTCARAAPKVMLRSSDHRLLGPPLRDTVRRHGDLYPSLSRTCTPELGVLWIK